MRALLARFMRDASGVAASEFALVVAFFITIVFGTISTGLAMSAVNQIHYAAERSARCLATTVTTASTAGSCAAGVDAYAKNWYRGPGVSGLTFVASDQTCGKRVVGSATYYILTGFKSTAITISAKACYPLI